MNLLYDPWIPVEYDGGFRHATLKEVLCTDGDYRLTFHRDDMELAALQLIVCLVQAVFTPADDKELRKRAGSHMPGPDYDAGAEPFRDMFVLDHPEHPFMQTRGVKAGEATPVQKLFIGLPEGNNHSFFNDAGEVANVCPSCVAVALFNQASNCPSFGGGFKGSLRGSSPITTFVLGNSLREGVWRNVLTAEKVRAVLPLDGVEDRPVWVEPVGARSQVPAHRVGMFRGLFWQAAHVEIEWTRLPARCDACGAASDKTATGFYKEKFNYELAGTWPHPHSPLGWDLKKGEKEQRFASFTTTAPAWTQLTEFLMKKESQKEGNAPAAVVSQFGEVFPGERLRLVAGGYRVKQALVLQRRHEMISLPAGWAENTVNVDGMVSAALDIKDALRGKVYRFGKEAGAPGLSSRAEALFYQESERDVHETLREMDWREAAKARARFADNLARLARRIFEEVTEPYRGNPANLRKLAASRRALNAALNKITGKGEKK